MGLAGGGRLLALWVYWAVWSQRADKANASLNHIAFSHHFLAAALAVGGNVNKLMMLVRRTSGALELLDVEQSVAFFRRFDQEVATVTALQVSTATLPKSDPGASDAPLTRTRA